VAEWHGTVPKKTVQHRIATFRCHNTPAFRNRGTIIGLKLQLQLQLQLQGVS